MRIIALEAFPVAIPFREPYVTATGTLERREMILVRLTAGGEAGWGDAVPLSLRGGDPLDEVLTDLEGACRELLVGATLGPDAGSGLVEACAEAGASPPALAAVDAALLDLAGRSSGEPAWQLLGARSAGAVECNGTLGGGDSGEVAGRAAELARAGFRTLKIKVGTGADRERVEAVRDAADPSVALRVDANGSWDVETATAELGAMGALELAEQPCATLEELAEMRGLVEVPVVADESVGSAVEAERAQEIRACDAATLKLSKVGGPRRALAIAAGLPCYLSSALDSPLGIAAAAATARAMPPAGFAHGLATSLLFADNVADASAMLGPTIEPTGAPGLGVEVDEAAVERLLIR
jgi:L-alanine-DL-glutamate epimerase-like enolase superfamily enzyme